MSKYREFYNKNGYVPQMFNPYNCTEIDSGGVSPTITTQCGSTTSSATVLIIENKYDLIRNKKLIKHKPVEKENYSMGKLRVFEAFKGYGSQSCSLEDCGIPYEVVASSEIDSDAIIAYAAIRFDKKELIKKPIDITDDEIAKWLMDRNIGLDFKQGKSKVPLWAKKKDKTYLYTVYNSAIISKELGDISLIEPEAIPDYDLFTMSSPCQDFSVAGKQEGGSWKCNSCNEEFNPIESDFKEECPYCNSTNIKKTRSSLLFECAKNIRVKKPKYILLENVKNLVGTKHIDTFNKWCEWLESQGCTNTYKVVNGKDYGVPQNRERVFMVSILGDEKFEFPNAPCTPVRLKDILQDEVDEKYYINKPFTFIDKQGTECIRRVYDGNKNIYSENGISPTLLSRDYKDPKRILTSCAMRGRYNEDGSAEQQIEVRKDDVANCITSVQKDSMVIENPTIIDDMYANRDVREYTDVCPTLRSERYGLKVKSDYRVRKLTPLECWRLMAMSDERYYKVKEMGISDSQMYKLAGNSIIKTCLDSIFKELFKQYIVSDDTSNFTQSQED